MENIRAYNGITKFYYKGKTLKLNVENILLSFITILLGIILVFSIQYNMIDDNEVLDKSTLNYLASIEHYVEKDVKFDVNKKNNTNIVFIKKRQFTQKEINRDVNLMIVSFIENG